MYLENLKDDISYKNKMIFNNTYCIYFIKYNIVTIIMHSFYLYHRKNGCY